MYVVYIIQYKVIIADYKSPQTSNTDSEEIQFQTFKYKRK